MTAIWYHDGYNGSLEALRRIVACPAVTHVMLGAMHANDLDWRDPDGAFPRRVREAIDVVQGAAGVQLIWCRNLTPYYRLNGFANERLLDSSYYVDTLTALRAEAAELGAQAVALDTEAYGNSPFKAWTKSGLVAPADVAARVSAAVDAAAASGCRADFVLPAGSLSTGHLYQVLARLGERRICEHTYSGRPATYVNIRYSWEVAGLWLSLTPGDDGRGGRLHTPVREVLSRPELRGGRADVFLFPKSGESDQVAAALSQTTRSAVASQLWKASG